MQKLLLRTRYTYRVIIYAFLVFLSSFIVGFYSYSGIIFYLGFTLIIVSILFDFTNKQKTVDAIILSDESSDSLKFIFNGIESDFWLIKNHIIINTWIYLYVIQQGSNKKLKLWLHQSNFIRKNDLRDLSRYLLSKQND